MIRKWLVSAALAGLLVCLAVAALSFARTAQTAAVAAPAALTAELGRQGDAAQKLLDRRAGDLLRQVIGLREDVAALSEETRNLVDRHATNVEQLAGDRLDRVAGIVELHATNLEILANSQLSAVNQTFALAVAPAAPLASLLKRADDTAPLFLDCEYNPDCLFNRYTGVAKGVEQASLAIGKAAPGMSQSFARIALDTSIFTDKLTEKKPWYKHVPDVVFGAARLGAAFK